MKKIKQLLLVLFLIVIGLLAAGCGLFGKESKKEIDPFVFRTEVPTEAGVYDEIYFRSYFKQVDDILLAVCCFVTVRKEAGRI